MKEKLKQYAPQLRFLGGAALLLLIWVLIESFRPSLINHTHNFLIEWQVMISAKIIPLFNHHITYYFGDPGCWARLYFSDCNCGHVCVGTGCSGTELFVIFAGFIFLFQGKWYHKIWFMLVGLLAILVLNIIRIISLTFINRYYPDWMDFNHKYTFVIIVYGAIFLLWVVWVKYFATRGAQKSHDEK